MNCERLGITSKPGAAETISAAPSGNVGKTGYFGAVISGSLPCFM